MTQSAAASFRTVTTAESPEAPAYRQRNHGVRDVRIARNVMLIGPPGAGKGTQAVRLAEITGLPIISMGDTLRRIARTGSAAGQALRSVMERGELLGDDLIIDIVKTRLDQTDTVDGFVLDGFPRTVAQAEALEGLLDSRGPLVVFELVVPVPTLIQRLHDRRVCNRCGVNAEPAGPAGHGDDSAAACRCGGLFQSRSDDTEAVVLERLRVHERSTRPLADFYRNRRALHIVDGTSPPDRVAVHIGDTLNRLTAFS